MADVLGIFGRDQVAMASMWHAGDGQAFAYGGFQIYRNYDGQGSRFGDTSITATTSDPVSSSVYAAIDSSDPSRLSLVAINKLGVAQIAEIGITHDVEYRTFRVYVLDENSYDPSRSVALPQASAPVRAVSPSQLRYEGATGSRILTGTRQG